MRIKIYKQRECECKFDLLALLGASASKLACGDINSMAVENHHLWGFESFPSRALILSKLFDNFNL